MVVRMRHTKGHTRNRRSHHAVKEARLSACGNCGAPHVRHKACAACGMYRGKEVMDVLKKVTKKEKKARAREREQR